MPESHSRRHVRAIALESENRLKAASWAIICLAAMAILAACQPAPPAVMPPDGSIYFPQTGHSVRGPFRAYFQAHGGTESFGYPITEEFLRHGLVVQYFEKARMEYHPENPPRYRVQLGLLGETLGRREPPIPPHRAPPAFDPSRRYYPQTGHTLTRPFLAYYDAQGGLDRFGYPLSEPYRLHGALIQDFQRARMISRDGEIQIADWGRMFLGPHSSIQDRYPGAHHGPRGLANRATGQRGNGAATSPLVRRCPVDSFPC